MAATPRSPLVGRDRELALLRECLDAAIGEHGSLVLLSGEAGIGKTTLAETLCREAMQRGAHVLVGRCYDLAETPPYGPWVELFAHYPVDAARTSLPPAFARRDAMGEIAHQAALFAQVLGFFTDVGTQRPILLFLDDLHWADPVSLDLLRSLARNLTTLPILIVAAYRVEEVARDHPLYTLLPALVREAHAGRLDLRRLGFDSVRALVQARYALAEDQRERLVSYLDARAEGNPFFIGELLRTLEEEAILQSGDTGWSLGDLTHVRLPTLLGQVIDARLMRLGEETQQLLAIAAVIGQEVPLALWATVARVPESVLLDAIQRAVEAHVMAESPDGTRVRFVHALIRQALYDGLLPSLLPSRRRVWHQRVGEALLAEASPDPDAVAYHFRRAGDERAAEWLTKAGARAEHAHAWLTAAERYEAAVDLQRAQPGDERTQGWLLLRVAWLRRFADPASGIASVEQAILLAQRLDDAQLTARALTMRGILRCRNRLYRQGLADLQAGVAALEALSTTDDVRQQETGLVGTAYAIHDARSSLALWLASAGRYHDARVIAERAVTEVATTHSADALEDVHSVATYGLALVHAARGHPEDARVAFARARMACRAIGNFAGAAQAALHELEWAVLPYQTDQLADRQTLAAESEEAWVLGSGALREKDSPRLQRLPLLFLEGDWRDARQVAQTVRAVGGDGARLFMATRILAELAFHQGEADLAWSLVQEWVPADPTTPPGDARFLDAIAMRRLAARLTLARHDLQAAHAWITAHDKWLVWSGAVLGQAAGRLLWADYYRALGDVEQAYQCASEARVLATNPRQPLALLAAHRLLGELETGTGHLDAGYANLMAALSLADGCAVPYERALTLLALAALRTASGERTEAKRLLDEARGTCLRLDARPALMRADALAASLAAPAYPDGLTKREVEVLRLVASGMTTDEVAATLFVSGKTVERHITGIYRKINARGRADATAYALHHFPPITP